MGVLIMQKRGYAVCFAASQASFQERYFEGKFVSSIYKLKRALDLASVFIFTTNAGGVQESSP